jgi:hypothetical protein
MRRLATALAVTASLAVAVPAAEARPPLDYARAKQNAQHEAKKAARQDRRIAEWEITRAFRFTSTKWVFVWWAQLDDGRVCTAQLVSRYRNSKQRKVISYFRKQDCG